MAKKINKNVNINRNELQSQVIGYVQEKKNNIGRVAIIFIAFLLVIFYLPQVTVFINDIFGMHSSPTLKDNGKDNEKNNPLFNKTGNQEGEENKIIYHEFNNSLEIEEKDFKVNGFAVLNNQLTFNVVNTTNGSVDLTKSNYFIETYSDKKTLLERKKVDMHVLSANKSEKILLDINDINISYIIFTSKDRNDYPVVDLKKDELGYANLSCKKDKQTIKYTFKNDELVEVNDEVIYNFVASDTEYTNKYNEYQAKCTSYNNINGVTATFNSSLNGFTAAISVDMGKVDMKDIEENHYYTKNEEPKVISFEMQTYGYTCS